MWKWLFPALFALSCDGRTDDAAAVRDSISDMRTETSRYLQAAEAIDTMGDMRIEVLHHADIAMPIMSDMRTNMDSMETHCGPMDSMYNKHDEMTAELSSHTNMMLDVGTLTAAMSEVERHTTAMNADLADMTQMMGMMPCR